MRRCSSAPGWCGARGQAASTISPSIRSRSGASRAGPPATSGSGATASTSSRHSSKRTEREIDDADCRNEPDHPPPPGHGPPPHRSLARRGLRRMGRTRPVQTLARAAPGHSPQGRGRRALVLGGGPCRPSVAALLPLPARGAPAAAGVHVDVDSDARARVPGDRRDDAVPRRHRPGVDAQRAPRRRDGPWPRGWLEALHRHPGREDQRTAVRKDTRRKETRAMTKHMTGTRKEWLAARLALLEAEKELTRRSDELARRRQELPWVRIDKDYRFETDEGMERMGLSDIEGKTTRVGASKRGSERVSKASLADLFRGRSQLLVYHFMFGPDYTAGCPSCSAIADGFNGIAAHLANHDVMLWAVSRAPLAKLQAYKRRMGWTFAWASSSGGDFNFDFNVSFTERQQREGAVEYNYERGGHALDATTAVPEPVAQNAAMAGTDAATYTRERPGMSAFVLEDGVVYHTYSTYARGLDGLWGMYQWLDRAPKGRNETGIWWRRHDEYKKG